ncbi:MAG: class II fructose-bisphosphate aldolase [Lachnospiraceae bacterium]|nr:class II fructose-bisphosphate aldolase [Lachnospiraceae bacterium]
MPLCKTLDILRDCERRQYAVGAFNINGLDQPGALIRQAEKLGSPILMVEPGVIEQYVDFEDYVLVTARAAKQASVPVGIHLSHGLDLEQVERACKAGFTSVMYDGSKLPYEENVRNTKIAVEMGHKFGAAVEGELGALGSSFVDIKETMTDPDQARDFVARTGIDILAVAVGNAHGFYKGTPKLDFGRLSEIRRALMAYNCYLTLHGGTGIPKDHIQRSIQLGISKICIYTEMCHVGKEQAKDYIKAHPDYTGNYDIPDLIRSVTDGFTRAEADCMKMFMSTGKCGTSKADDEIPANTDLGPEYPSLVALNPGYHSVGGYWDKNL